jgi:H/ACA ribonucleoprotein complex subunit 4
MSEDYPKKIIKDLTLSKLRSGEHTIPKLLQTGAVNLNKPMGPTSHQVSSWVKLMFEAEKVGHGGTLDPRVTGVLPLAIGSSARILSVFTQSTKEYVGVMRLHQNIPTKKVKHIFDEFVGDIYQFPPLRSAVKRQLRIRTIHSLELLEHNRRDVLFKVECASGTYIRSLVHDIGLVLGSGAHMQELRRTKTGAFHESEAVTLQELKDALVFWQEDGEEKSLRNCLWPLETLVMDLPKIIIQDSAVDAICHGAPLAIPGVIQFEEILRRGEFVAMFTQKFEGVAIGRTQMQTTDILDSKSGVMAKTWRVLMAPGTYKKGWKTKE